MRDCFHYSELTGRDSTPAPVGRSVGRTRINFVVDVIYHRGAYQRSVWRLAYTEGLQERELFFTLVLPSVLPFVRWLIRSFSRSLVRLVSRALFQSQVTVAFCKRKTGRNFQRLQRKTKRNDVRVALCFCLRDELAWKSARRHSYNALVAWMRSTIERSAELHVPLAPGHRGDRETALFRWPRQPPRKRSK